MSRIQKLDDKIRKYSNMAGKCEEHLREIVKKLVEERNSLKDKLAKMSAAYTALEQEHIRSATESIEKDKMIEYFKQQNLTQQESSTMVRNMMEVAIEQQRVGSRALAIGACTNTPSTSQTPNQREVELIPSELTTRADVSVEELERIGDESNQGIGPNDENLVDDDVEFIPSTEPQKIHAIFSCQ